jgi:rhamnosyltransferase
VNVSIVIRTLNEAEHLGALLDAIARQDYDAGSVETVLVDSGSTDATLAIAASHGMKIVHIAKDEFSFGRSLNLGCAAASGEALVFVSGHCVPAAEDWITKLAAPLRDRQTPYCYGGQLGAETSRFSEKQIFSKYFPPVSRVPQEGFFCNNANSALLKSVWETNPFDEQLTGLEDMHLAKRLVEQGYAIGYVADAAVYHIHDERWRQVRLRFEREAIALQRVMPEVHLSFGDFLRYVSSAVLLDLGSALQQGCFRKVAREIFLYRLMQFWGAYRGNHVHRTLSRSAKHAYFYPR